jgi:exosortase K
VKSKVVSVAVTLAGVYWLKRYYSHATVDDLDWILRPTVWLLEALTRRPFPKEAGVGWFNRDVGFAVIPACAGVNFLCAAFAALVLTQLHRRPHLWLPVAAVVAYAATVVANTARLVVAVALHAHHVAWGPLTASRLHQIESVFVYVTALMLLTLTVSRKPCAA